MSLSNITIAFNFNDHGSVKQVQIPVKIDKDTTVFHIKKALSAQIKLETWRFNLSMGELELKEAGALLSAYGIPNKAVLQLIINPGSFDPALVLNEFKSVLPAVQPYC